MSHFTSLLISFGGMTNRLKFTKKVERSYLVLDSKTAKAASKQTVHSVKVFIEKKGGLYINNATPLINDNSVTLSKQTAQL